MTKQLNIPHDVEKTQKQSSDPTANVWLSANAGSGKTHVLTERVIRLLLGGTKPARILCLTYTKAAAANMQSRIFDRLSRWITLSDEELKQALLKIEGKPASPEKLSLARRLFAYALETPGGLKIQTIHAFCESILHQFPLEANIPGHFEMMDDAAQREAITAIKKQFFTKIQQQKNSDIAKAFYLILDKTSEESLNKLINAAIADKQALSRYAAQIVKQGLSFFYQIFELQPWQKKAEKEKLDLKSYLFLQLKQKATFSEADLSKILTLGGKKAASFVQSIKELASLEEEQLIISVNAAYFTKGNIKKAPTLFSKAAITAWPELEDIFNTKANYLKCLLEKIHHVILAELNQAAYILINDLLERYGNFKKSQGLLDFGDLIDRTLALLKRSGAGLWVQYRLDQGIDHILVDEAQDTGPEQWEIIRLLSQDFFSGIGAREDLERTIFAVGDEKQSIYSFQGAVPQDFAENGHLIKRKAMAAEKLFRYERLPFSFRSTPDVLAAVDEVFALPQNYKGLSAENIKTVHSAIRSKDQGYVDIWPVETSEGESTPEDWTETLDTNDSPAVRLAEKITKRIKYWLDNGEILDGKNRPIRTGDIMVLVRSRGPFVQALARALKNNAIPVAGADRLQLIDHIAIQDLIALGNFVLQPRDDLSLAAVLKSPLFNLSEDILFKLAANRRSTLFAALEKAVYQQSLPEYHEHLKPCLEKLYAYRSFADIKPVYEFYEKVLAEDGGRRQFLARLGNEASDILDAFLDYCLSAQKDGLPGLQAFLQDLEYNSPEIKRELDQNRNEVRIMTVHASKGLEAPIVFLVDGISSIWSSQKAPALLPLNLPNPIAHQTPFTDKIALWLPSAKFKTELTDKILSDLKQANEEEYRRLLYVGMTRAEDRLIACGFYNKKNSGDTWLPVVTQALAPKAETICYPDSETEILRFWHKKEALSKPIISINDGQSHTDIQKLPSFLTHKPSPETALPRPLTPSGAVSIIETEPEIDPNIMQNSPILPEQEYDRQNESEQIDKTAKNITVQEETQNTSAPVFALAAIEKGLLIHNLLQYLPDIQPERRVKLATAYLQERLKEQDKALQTSILATVFKILDDPRFTHLFAQNSRAETALMGEIKVKGQQRMVSGQIDRLAIFDEKIIFADYKTGYVPADISQIPLEYKMQMALYAALLQSLYPQKEIEALLIYTRLGRVYTFELPDLLPILQ